MEQQEDEINLLDLLCVVLKYRYLIIITTLCALFLSLTYFYVLPRIIPSMNKNEYSIKAQITIDENTNNLQKNFINIVNKSLTNPTLIENCLIKNNFLLSKSGNNNMQIVTSNIINQIIGQKLNVNRNKNYDNLIFLEVIANNKDKGILFIQDIVQCVNTELKEQYLNTINENLNVLTNQIETLKLFNTKYNQILKTTNSAVELNYIQNQITNLEKEIRNINDQKRELQELNDTSSWLVLKIEPANNIINSKTKRIIIITLSVFLLAIICAFILDFIYTLSQSKSKKALIKQALSYKIFRSKKDE